MNKIFALWLLGFGLALLLRPAFFYKSKQLTPERIQRNNYIMKIIGIALAMIGLASLGLLFLRG